MSRSISIWYTTAQVNLLMMEVGNRDVLGTQDASMEFWRLPVHRTIGVERLAELGITDPVWFKGWDDLRILEKEVAALEAHRDDIPFDDELKGRWIRHLRSCLELLKKVAPADSVPEFMIG